LFQVPSARKGFLVESSALRRQRRRLMRVLCSLDGFVAATLSELGLLVKIQDFVVSITVTLRCVVSFLCALSWILSSLVLFDFFGGKLVAS
jgi:hypothetical protein